MLSQNRKENRTDKIWLYARCRVWRKGKSPRHINGLLFLVNIEERDLEGRSRVRQGVKDKMQN
jgi:hypothetical protein